MLFLFWKGFYLFFIPTCNILVYIYTGITRGGKKTLPTIHTFPQMLRRECAPQPHSNFFYFFFFFFKNHIIIYLEQIYGRYYVVLPLTVSVKLARTFISILSLSFSLSPLSLSPLPYEISGLTATIAGIVNTWAEQRTANARATTSESDFIIDENK